MMTGLSAPTSGKISYFTGESSVKLGDISFVAPYYNLYEDYTPTEIYKLVCTLRCQNPDFASFDSYMAKFELQTKKNIAIKNFSSGMKQRLKIILNLIGEFDAYFFDEPSSNLDIFGIETLQKEIENLKNNDKLVVIATNEPNEISWCNNIIKL
jgi:ABC-type multidrug transport system ATPase subunit